jgi:hypothetical protein
MQNKTVSPNQMPAARETVVFILDLDFGFWIKVESKSKLRLSQARIIRNPKSKI